MTVYFINKKLNKVVGYNKTGRKLNEIWNLNFYKHETIISSKKYLPLENEEINYQKCFFKDWNKYCGKDFRTQFVLLTKINVNICFE